MSEHRLHEIVIERPRYGSSDKNWKKDKKNFQITDDDNYEGSRYEPLCRAKTKALSDHLGPLRRLLRSKVGQRWDDIYSELCQRLDSSTVTGQHVLDHLWDYVERHVVLIDGVPYRKISSAYKQKPLAYWRNEFYIHPDTGILCLVEKAAKEPPKKRDDLVVIDSYHQYRKLNGLWYLITLQEFPLWQDVTDVVLKTTVKPWHGQCEYGREVYAVKKRQCNKKELKWIMSQITKV
ncbi:MAG: hypothetical protein U7123_15355 [Potamolinea sp.]